MTLDAKVRDGGLKTSRLVLTRGGGGVRKIMTLYDPTKTDNVNNAQPLIRIVSKALIRPNNSQSWLKHVVLLQ